MTRFTALRNLPWALAAPAIASAVGAAGPEPIRVGVIVPTSGPFASIGGEISTRTA